MADSDQFDSFNAHATDPVARATARGAIQRLEEIASALAPIVGESEATALFRRSILLCMKSFPWMKGSGPGFQNSMDLNALEISIAQQSAEAADAGARFLLLTFQDLLAGHVGNSFAEQLMGKPRQDDET
jgi:hypothetical protein